MSSFTDEDEFYRVIKRSQPGVLRSDGSVSSALFKNINEANGVGISVDCQDGRPLEEVIKFIKDCFGKRTKGIAAIIYQDIVNNKAVVLRSPPPPCGKEHHAELYKNEQKEALSNLQAELFAQQCRIVDFDNAVEWVNTKES